VNNFDFLKYFSDKDLRYKTSGKNIGGDWAALSDCFFCGKENYHLAVNQKKQQISCWVCGKHTTTELIKAIENCSWQKAKQILEQYSLTPDSILDQEEEIEIVRPNSYKLPQEFTELFPKEAKDYLVRRRYDFLTLRKKYGILWSENFGRGKFRIIFPVFENNKIVNWVGRDITGNKSIMPYMFEKNEVALVPRNELIYNLDNVKNEKCVLFEGLFNVLRFGNNSLALLSQQFTKQQIVKLKNKGIKKFYICFDNEEKAQEKAKLLEGYLTWADEINYIDLPENVNDFDELDDESVNYIKRMIF